MSIRGSRITIHISIILTRTFILFTLLTLTLTLILTLIRVLILIIILVLIPIALFQISLLTGICMLILEIGLEKFLNRPSVQESVEIVMTLTSLENKSLSILIKT